MSRSLQGVLAQCLDKGQSYEIEAMRLVAAVTVFIWHVWHWPMGGLISVFFVMSGFLIGQALMYHISAFGGRIMKKAFLTNILHRLMTPLLVLSITVFPMVLMFAPTEILKGESWRHLISVVGLSNANIPLSGTVLPAEYAVPSLTHEWTIGVQLQAYIIMLVLFSIAGYRAYASGSRAPLIKAIAVTAALSVSISIYAFIAFKVPSLPNLRFDFHYSNPISRLYQFLAGALLGLCIPELRRFALSLIRPAWVKIVAICVIVFGIQVKGLLSSFVFPGISEIVIVLGCVILLASGVMSRDENGNDMFKKGPSSSVTRIVNNAGGYTYAIYLTHWPIYALATMYFIPAHFDLTRNYSIYPSNISLLGAAFVLVGCAVGTALLRNVFEKRSNMVAKDEFVARNLALMVLLAASLPAAAVVAVFL